MRISSATVYAFDSNTEAISLCRAMAELNGVSSRVVTGEFCSPETLASLDLGSRYPYPSKPPSTASSGQTVTGCMGDAPWTRNVSNTPPPVRRIL